MVEERKVTIEGQVHTVIISDEHEALLAADAAGRAVIGLWDRNRPDQSLSPARFAVECLEDVSVEDVERAVRRKADMPWKIVDTKRLMVREFCMDDIARIPEEAEDTESGRIFCNPEKLREYIRCQYGFYQYGIWAVVRKEDGRIVGKAGLSDKEWEGGMVLELGYHIFLQYRNKGYGREACEEILRYAHVVLGRKVYAQIDASNEASIRLALSCGFHIIQKKYNAAGQCCCLYCRNC